MSNQQLVNQINEQLQRVIKGLGGDGPIEKQILLLKLTEVLENAPPFGDKPALDASTPQRQWLSKVGALLSRLGIDKKVQFNASCSTLAMYWVPAINQIKGQVSDAIEELKLELELDGRSDIGNAYAPGEIYRFFSDLKAIINTAENEVMIIDPYFNGEAFDAYLSTAQPNLAVRILADRYSKEINDYVKKHKAQFQTNIELRASKELHDRLIFVDREQCWIMGGSVKDAGKKATYLIPVIPQIAKAKSSIYADIWERALSIES